MSSREKFEQAIKARFGDSIDYRVCKNSDGEYMAWDMQVAWWAWQAAETDMAVQLANAESKCRELAAGHWPRLQEQDINALMRFNETCEDGEGYDIGAEAMSRLVEIGLAGKGPHGIRSITPFGQWVINAREGEVDLEPLKTEEDNIAESSLRMAQLRTGAAQ